MEVFNINFCCFITIFAAQYAMQARPHSRHAVSVHLYVRVSVTFVHCQNEKKNISSIFFHLRVATPFYLFRTKRHSNILTETLPITGASNARGLSRNPDSDPIFGFIACCERCDGQLLSTRLSADTRL